MCPPDAHCWQWARENNGVIEYICLNENCGEVMTQYVDTQGG